MKLLGADAAAPTAVAAAGAAVSGALGVAAVVAGAAAKLDSLAVPIADAKPFTTGVDSEAGVGVAGGVITSA
jgi:hypothetical protein